MMSIWFFIIVFGRAVFGATEEECTKLSTNEIIKLEVRTSKDIGGCDWLVGKILGNGSGFKFGDHSEYYDNIMPPSAIETWILIK